MTANENLKIFVAIDLPGRIKEALHRWQNKISPRLFGVRWEVPERLHLTLKFLGLTSPDKIPRINYLFQNFAQKTIGFSLEIRGVGFFPSESRPRVLWAGVGLGGERLLSIANELDESFIRIGFTPDVKPFVGHVTLGRFSVGGGGGVCSICEEFQDLVFGQFFINEISLMKSESSQNALSYEKLYVAKFS